MTNKKEISLCFRGFNLDPFTVESIIGHKANLLGSKGQPVRPGMKTLLTRSFLNFTIGFENDIKFDEMSNSLFLKLGGIDHLINVRNQIEPEFVDLDFLLRVKGSDEQDSGYFSTSTLDFFVKLKADLSFQFI